MALTLQRPWPWAILELGKPVENRTWRPPPYLIGRRFAIHEGLGWDEEGAAWIETTFRVVVPAHLQHAPARGVVATVLLAGVTRRSRDLWAAEGQFHWLLEDVRAIAPAVSCRGAQRLWALPRDVEREVLARERSAA
jgi:hypothetical protein